jgi:hypothetical protein
MLSSQILALAVSFPLLALGAPTKRQYTPSPTLSQVRQRAIELSSHRSVYALADAFPLTMEDIDEQRTAGNLARLPRH